jgi:hypothetical protein
VANTNITFDTDTGTPYPVNLSINTGVDFFHTFIPKKSNNTSFDFTSSTGSCQIKKHSAATSGIITCSVSFPDLNKIKISLGSTSNSILKEGRYVYDVNVSIGGTLFKMVNGSIMAKVGISSQV